MTNLRITQQARGMRIIHGEAALRRRRALEALSEEAITGFYGRGVTASRLCLCFWKPYDPVTTWRHREWEA